MPHRTADPCLPEKRKVTGSTPVPTTTDDQAKCLVIVRFWDGERDSW
jgi:hypothetical protein